MVSRSTTGSAKPARCRSAPASCTSAKGETRGPAPPSASSSAVRSVSRNSARVRPPSMAAMKSPSGRSARAIWIKRARQVVDPMQAEIARHQVEAVGRERQKLLVGRDRVAAARLARRRGENRRQIGVNEKLGADAAGQHAAPKRRHDSRDRARAERRDAPPRAARRAARRPRGTAAAIPRPRRACGGRARRGGRIPSCHPMSSAGQPWAGFIAWTRAAGQARSQF